MAFRDLTSELVGYLPGLDPFLAQTWVRRAWRAIRDARAWSFLTTEGVAVFPPAVSAGLTTITQYSATVTCDSAADVALTAGIPSIVGLDACQIRFAGGPVYSIISHTVSPLVLTLDRIVEEASGAVAYQVYRAYLPAPADFQGWLSFDDNANGFTIDSQRLSRTSQDFDRVDPQRQSQGLAYFVGFRSPDPITGSPIYELWPHPTSGQVFQTLARTRGFNFDLPADAQPSVIPDEMIMMKALGAYAYPWALANRERFPLLKGVNFLQLALDAKNNYKEAMVAAKRQDDALALQTVYNRGRGQGSGLPGPADSNYWQQHGIFW